MPAVQSPTSVSSSTETPKSTGHTVSTKHPAKVARRNARERNRIHQVNLGFVTLRNHVPIGPKKKKLSKVETIKQAVNYIQYLQDILASTAAPDCLNNTGYYCPAQTSCMNYGYPSGPAISSSGYISPSANLHNYPSENLNPASYCPSVPGLPNYRLNFAQKTQFNSGMEQETFTNYAGGPMMDFTGLSSNQMQHQVQQQVAVQNKISPQNTSGDSSLSNSSFLSDVSYEMTLSPQDLKYSNTTHGFVVST